MRRIIPLFLLVTSAGAVMALAPLNPRFNYQTALDAFNAAPNDPYRAYVLAQVAVRENKLALVAPLLEPRNPNPRGRAMSADLFSLFSGGLAIQEALQLDAFGIAPMTAPPVAPNDPMIIPPTVPLRDLKGPQVKSHPWVKMIGDKQPDIDPLAMYVPEDMYFVQFRSITRLVEAMNLASITGNHLFTQMLDDAATNDTAARLKRQLGLSTDAKMLPIYDTFVSEIAVTGSDLYLQTGSDVTLIIHGKAPNVIKVPLTVSLEKFVVNVQNVRKSETTHQGVSITGYVTADRSISAYAADPLPDVHLRSNSLVAIKRIIDAIQDRVAMRLGNTSEFRYMRTLFPRNAAEEDGFVYLSDSFIRRMVSPEVRIMEYRRQIALSHLRMISYGSLLYQTEHGLAAKSLAELLKAQCTPGIFGRGQLQCPMNGTYELIGELVGQSSVWGTTSFATPVCEVKFPEDRVTGEEARQYRNFEQEYSQYWRTYFDPIALRMQFTPKIIRMETVILPLIDNTIYSAIASVVNGKEVALDRVPTSQRNVATISMKIDKSRWIKREVDPVAVRNMDTVQSTENLNRLGQAFQDYHSANDRFPTVDRMQAPTARKLSWRVELLPYLHEEALYRQFKLDEPWDSEHNKKLIIKIPKVFQSPQANRKLHELGKTVYQLPVHAKGMFPPKGKGTTIGEITDGLSNMIMVVETRNDAAVIWTKPDDIEITNHESFDKLRRDDQSLIFICKGDGSTGQMSTDINSQVIMDAITISGNETEFPLPPSPSELSAQPQLLNMLGNLLGLNGTSIDPQLLASTIVKGFGDHISVSMHDSTRLLNLDWNASVMNPGGTLMGFAPLLQILTCPVSVAIPVQDTKIVDQWLKAIDEKVTGTHQGGGMFNIRKQFYTFKGPGDSTIRACTFHLDSLRWRLCWGRIGNRFYVVTRPNLLEELANAEKATLLPPATPDMSGHIMLRLHPQNWREVLMGYELGWSEDSQQAAFNQLPRLTSILQAYPNDERPDHHITKRDMVRYQIMYGSIPQCPDGGNFIWYGRDKGCWSDRYGHPTQPMMPAKPGPQHASTTIVNEVADITATLTLSPEGLRAVVRVIRK